MVKTAFAAVLIIMVLARFARAKIQYFAISTDSALLNLPPVFILADIPLTEGCQKESFKRTLLRKES